MGFAGISVDVGYLDTAKQQAQQTATDAAAVGGAENLAHQNCHRPHGGRPGGVVLDAGNNGFANGGSVAVQATSPPASGPYAGNTCAISVKVTTSSVSTFFARLSGCRTAWTRRRKPGDR